MELQRERGLTYDAELLLKQRNTVKIRDWVQRYRRIRLKIYDFLDHPSSNFTVGSVLYHISAFIIVLIAVILGASTDSLGDHQWMIKIYSGLETSLAVFFLIEFLIRMWAISADAKYMGWKGHIQYLKKFVCITDIIIIIVTFVILIVDKRYVSDKTMDYLRFIQILRLFHIDRQMTTWRLIRNMVIISRRELITAYYITFVLIVFLANLVYYTEHYEDSHNFFVNSSEVSESPVKTLAHAWWFSIVTITTIGYGDIVPFYSFSKVIVCILGYLAYCTFVTASTQISVGLTLMMEEDNKNEYKKRLKHSAASLIQNWWRYHMASALLNDNRYRTTYFKDCCYKLYLTADNLSKMRAFEKKQKERKEKKKRQQKIIQAEWKSSLRLGVTTQLALQPTGLAPTVTKRMSLPQIGRFMSLPTQDIHAPTVRPLLATQPTMDDMSKYYKRDSMDSSMNSFSFDASDSEHSFTLHKVSSINSISAMDEKLLHKYKPLLRFIFFLNFQLLREKFKRQRKADKLLEMEAEIIEQIHERDQKLNELEMEFTRITGKVGVSYLASQEDKKSVSQRIELCEEKMINLTKKVEQMDQMTQLIYQMIEGPPSSLHHLPPRHPGRVFGRPLRRQSKTFVLEETEDPE